MGIEVVRMGLEGIGILGRDNRKGERVIGYGRFIEREIETVRGSLIGEVIIEYKI
jgi:hypothetical protein